MKCSVLNGSFRIPPGKLRENASAAWRMGNTCIIQDPHYPSWPNLPKKVGCCFVAFVDAVLSIIHWHGVGDIISLLMGIGKCDEDDDWRKHDLHDTKTVVAVIVCR
jgi:hypothetical protein